MCLVYCLWCIAGITRVFFGSDFVTVTKSEDSSWEFLKPEIFAAIMDFYSSGQPLFLDSKAAAAMDTAIRDVNMHPTLALFQLIQVLVLFGANDYTAIMLCLSLCMKC